jgi:L-alanine-DL-glutamate epimerase-like enolase superfamily enzyme
MYSSKIRTLILKGQLMKITAIRPIPLRGWTDETGWDFKLDPGENQHTLIEIETEGGLTGTGSVYTTQALVEASLRLLGPFVIGENALEPERVSEKLHQMTFWNGRGGAVTHTISGIDIALWDILGKATGQPVARLLGGYYRRKIKPYASLLFDQPDALRETLLQALARGFRAVKLGWGPFGRGDAKGDEILVRTARETVGPAVDIMVDAGGSEQFWPRRYKWALETAHMLKDYGVAWFEEALPPDDIDNFVLLRQHSPVPVSSCEVLTRRQSFIPWIERGAVDIVQPDLTKVGGLSEGRRIAWMAYDHHVQVVTHGWNTAVGLAADLHLAAAMPVAKYVEFITPSPYIDEILAKPFALDADGMLAIPEAPGLGIELNPEAVARMST